MLPFLLVLATSWAAQSDILQLEYVLQDSSIYTYFKTGDTVYVDISGGVTEFNIRAEPVDPGSFTSSVDYSIKDSTMTEIYTHTESVYEYWAFGGDTFPGDPNTPDWVPFEGTFNLQVSWDMGASLLDTTLVYASVGINMPTVTVLDEAVGYATFDVFLYSQPTADVEVCFSSLADVDISLDVCCLTFTTLNWNIAQTVHVFGLPLDQDGALPATTDITIQANSTSTDTDYNDLTRTSRIEKQNKRGSKCTSWGDPHFVTWDGLKFDLYEIGDYVLLQDYTSEFVVQARQNVCSTVACNYGVAVKFKGVVATVLLAGPSASVPTLRLDGDDPSTVSMTIQELPNPGYLFKLGNGASVKVVVGYWRGRDIHYLMIYPQIPFSYQGRIRGLCGTFDQNTGNDFHDATGTTVSESVFTSAWLVDPVDSLFVDPTNTYTPLEDETGDPAEAEALNLTRASCPGFTTPDPDDITDEVVEDSSNTPHPNYTEPFNESFVPSTTPNWTTEEETAAEEVCNGTFSGCTYDWCVATVGVSALEAYNVCMFDMGIIQDDQAAVASYQSFVEECYESANQQDLDAPGGCVSCSSQCYNRGTCISTDLCTCDSGYAGDQCDEDTTIPPSLSECGVLYNESMVEYVDVFGNFFWDTIVQLDCVWNNPEDNSNTTLTGTRKTNNRVQCPTTILNPSSSIGNLFVYADGVLTPTYCSVSLNLILGSSGGQDPHFHGFNGQHLHLTNLDELGPDHVDLKYLTLFCHPELAFVTELASRPDGMLFMNSFFMVIPGDMFLEFNLHKGLKTMVLDSTVESYTEVIQSVDLMDVTVNLWNKKIVINMHHSTDMYNGKWVHYMDFEVRLHPEFPKAEMSLLGGLVGASLYESAVQFQDFWRWEVHTPYSNQCSIIKENSITEENGGAEMYPDF